MLYQYKSPSDPKGRCYKVARKAGSLVSGLGKIGAGYPRLQAASSL